MTSTIVNGCADAIKTMIEGLAHVPAIKVYRWWPGMDGLDSVPAAVIHVPRLGRSEVDGTESQLFSNDWRMDFGIEFYADLSVAVAAQQQLVDMIELFVLAVDANRSLGLGALILDASVTEVESPDVIEDQARPLLFTRATLQLTRFV